jgi:hypothetical protein
MAERELLYSKRTPVLRDRLERIYDFEPVGLVSLSELAEWVMIYFRVLQTGILQ